MNLRSLLAVSASLYFLASANPASAATITNVTPPLSARGLHVIDIFGNGFAPGGTRPATLSVDFNNVISTTSPFFVIDDSHIQVTNVPAAASSGYIHVIVNGGPTAQSPQQFRIISPDAYITNFTPLYGNVDTPVTVTGVQFIAGGITNVMFNGIVSKKTAGTPVINSDNSITVTAPAGVTSGPLVLMSKFGTAFNFSSISNQISNATNFLAQATLTSFFPSNGGPTTNVVLTGTNFTAISGILFGSVSAPDFTISNNNSIRVTVPSGASTGKITVSPPAGTLLSPAISTLTFRILPTISNFSPTSGPVGTVVTLTGSGLNEQSPAPTVHVGSGVVISFTTVSPGTLVFNVPSTATSGPITVTTTNGSVVSSQIFYLPANIISFTPTNGAAGTLVKITGNNFTNASAVSFNGISTTNFVVTNNTTIGAIAPPGVTSGVISITTPFGTTNSTGLFYVAPTITDFTPTHGVPGIRVTINGTSFTNASAVLFNGAPATSFIVTNNTTLSAVVPTNVTTGKISVTAPGGTGVSTNDFVLDTADLSISGSDSPDPVFVGSNLVYTIVITNSGPTSALNVRFTNTLALSAPLTSATTSQGILATNTAPIITGSLGDIANQSAATITLTVKPTTPGLITNTAAIGTTSSIDSNPTNNTVSIVTTVWPLPILSITNLMSNDLVKISWPAPLSNFTLQFNGNLTNFWTNDTTPRVVLGTNISVIETNIGPPRFFRLTN